MLTLYAYLLSALVVPVLPRANGTSIAVVVFFILNFFFLSPLFVYLRLTGRVYVYMMTSVVFWVLSTLLLLRCNRYKTGSIRIKGAVFLCGII